MWLEGWGAQGTGGLLPFVGNSGTCRQRLRSPGVGGRVAEPGLPS